MIKPVHYVKAKDKWFFWDETWGHEVGPYDSEEEAKRALKNYCKNILDYENNNEDKNKKHHKWDGWPNAVCMNCGIPNYLEEAIGCGYYDPHMFEWEPSIRGFIAYLKFKCFEFCKGE